MATSVDQHGFAVVLGDKTRKAQALAVRDDRNALHRNTQSVIETPVQHNSRGDGIAPLRGSRDDALNTPPVQGKNEREAYHRLDELSRQHIGGLFNMHHLVIVHPMVWSHSCRRGAKPSTFEPDQQEVATHNTPDRLTKASPTKRVCHDTEPHTAAIPHLEPAAEIIVNSYPLAVRNPQPHSLRGSLQVLNRPCRRIFHAEVQNTLFGRTGRNRVTDSQRPSTKERCLG